MGLYGCGSLRAGHAVLGVLNALPTEKARIERIQIFEWREGKETTRIGRSGSKEKKGIKTTEQGEESRFRMSDATVTDDTNLLSRSMS